MAKYNPRRSNGYRRNKIRETIRRQGKPCALCGQPIDYSLPYGDPMSFEVDEIIPVSRFQEGGYSSAKACALDINNCQPTHRICNLRKGNKLQLDESIQTNQSNYIDNLYLPISRNW